MPMFYLDLWPFPTTVVSTHELICVMKSFSATGKLAAPTKDWKSSIQQLTVFSMMKF